jgi:hypothetical protein
MSVILMNDRLHLTRSFCLPNLPDNDSPLVTTHSGATARTPNRIRETLPAVGEAAEPITEHITFQLLRPADEVQ